jgi:cobalt transporter subunit CbtB
MNRSIDARIGATTTERDDAAGAPSLAAPLCAATLGLILLYAAGFATTEALHNGAHDARHSAGFACH